MMKCIASFLPLMATCSFAILLHTTPQLAHINEPAWYRVLNEKYRIHPEWLNGICNSPMTDFKVQHVGMFVDVVNCQWLLQVPSLIHANVPVWLCYGMKDDIQSAKHAVATKYYPTPTDIRDVLWKQAYHELAIRT
ncbi:hypothetical protein K439DRAFT_1620664 [Ramaria rubella]|nr:hypothetical protein K439DRAFT_1620664 [Ramaria rubella]